MRVAQVGKGTPEIAVLAGVHGDEPCGVRAVDRMLEEDLPVARPVKFVVANERALKREVRYVDEDLNRAFPADPNASSHEGRLANDLSAELEGCLTLSMHSTKSYGEPFAIVPSVTNDSLDLCSQLPVTSVVEAGDIVEGRLFTETETIEVECGLQGSDSATENAYVVSRAFLAAVGALPGESVPQPPPFSEESLSRPKSLPVYRLETPIRKERADQYEVFVENFERVEAGDCFAAADDTHHVADEPFYPVLLSPDGYRDVFGYAAQLIDTRPST